MFDPVSTPRVFAVPVGCDFSRDFVAGLLHRLKDQPPEAIARVEIYINTRRMERRISELLLQNGPRLLPRLRLITDLASHPKVPVDLPESMPKLQRQLLLARLIKALLKQEPELAPQSAVFDLAGSLAALMDEMQGEGVPFSALESISTDELSGHWERSLKFLRILSQYWDETGIADPQRQLRQAALGFAAEWEVRPPDHPVIVAGSTASRGASAEFMRAVAKLPQGAVILPGVDRALPEQAWDDLCDPGVLMDHPQSGINKFCRSVSLVPSDLPDWTDCRPCQSERNALISLALRPAPFTDQWLTEGPALVSSLSQSCKNMTIIEAESQKQEASAVALRLRNAAENGVTAVLVSPDRGLTRRVAVNLNRWGIIPDDSAGRPLHLTPPGVFLRLISGCFGQRLTPLTLVSLLKHPLAASGSDTGKSRLFARELERQELRGGAPFVNCARIVRWATSTDNPELLRWARWLTALFEPLERLSEAPLMDWVVLHRNVAEKLAAGPGLTGSGVLWEKEAGKQAGSTLEGLFLDTGEADAMSASEYCALFVQFFRQAEVRESVTAHPEIAIWGTLEARVRNVDLVILGGLNEGVWPKAHGPDPWLNRLTRKQIGLPLPERQTGLSAHDFQQAIAANEVVLTRSVRDSDAPTVASRWFIRMANLINGLGDEGNAAFRAMQDRGSRWINLARMLDCPGSEMPREPRPAPCPPLDARPRKLSVTRIKTLIRDPYSIYARDVLRLKPLDGLGREPDALMRGIALHEVLEKFIAETQDGLPEEAAEVFLKVAEQVLAKEAPWPATRRFWLARLARIADWFVTQEKARRHNGHAQLLERSGQRRIDSLDFLVTAKADRIDVDRSGSLTIYDYKSGLPPSPGDIRNFDKQLQLEAAIAEAGGFDGVDAAKVVGLEYIGLGASRKKESEGKIQQVEVTEDLTARVWAELQRLTAAYQNPAKGYPARTRMQKLRDASDYDHLSRRGEWQDSDPAVLVQVP